MEIGYKYSPPETQAPPPVKAAYEGVVTLFQSSVDHFKALFRKTLANPNKTHRYLQDREHFWTEAGFLRGRTAATHQPEDRMEACARLAVERFPLSRILAATSEEENRRLHEEATYLRNIYYSQVVTLEVGECDKFEELQGLPRIEFILFLLEKVSLGYNSGNKITKNNYDEIILDDADLRLERIQRNIRHLLREADMIGADAPSSLKGFRKAVAAMVKVPAEDFEPPKEAPELYKERADSKESPEDFTRRVYASWLGKGLLRPHVKQLDKPLYQALYKHGIPNDFETLLPTAQGRAVEHLSRSDAESMQRKRELTRASVANLRKRSATV